LTAFLVAYLATNPQYPKRYSARVDGQMTLDDFIGKIPLWQRPQLEDDLHDLLASGYGQLTFTLVAGKLTTWEVTISRKVARRSDD